MLLISPLDNSAIADTVAAVFSDPAYSAHQTLSLWDIALRWLAELLARLFGVLAQHPAVGQVIRWAMVVALVLIAARIGYAFFWRQTSLRFRYGQHGSPAGGDWWMIAQRLASEGQYTDAAHALYMALIAAATRQGWVSPHESKTTGDYLREFRRNGASANLTGFTDFTRSYETVIYGIGACDSQRFDRLNSLAAALLAAALLGTAQDRPT